MATKRRQKRKGKNSQFVFGFIGWFSVADEAWAKTDPLALASGHVIRSFSPHSEGIGVD
jgi:hypothetical protein